MTTASQVYSAIEKVSQGFASQYINASGKVIRVSNHGANPDRVDDNTISLVVGNSDQSYRSDRGRTVTSWERSNQWYVDADGCFEEQFESVEQFLGWFDIED